MSASKTCGDVLSKILDYLHGVADVVSDAVAAFAAVADDLDVAVAVDDCIVVAAAAAAAGIVADTSVITFAADADVAVVRYYSCDSCLKWCH